MTDNELVTLEAIHLFVEILDQYFQNVCELDLVFNFHKVYLILDEFIIGGEFQETSKKVRTLSSHDTHTHTHTHTHNTSPSHMDGRFRALAMATTARVCAYVYVHVRGREALEKDWSSWFFPAHPVSLCVWGVCVCVCVCCR